MTKNRKQKKAARARKEETGEPYMAARRATSEPQEYSMDDFDEFLTTEELILAAMEGVGEGLVGESVRVPNSSDMSGLLLYDLPDDLLEPSIHQAEMPTEGISIDIVEEYERGMELCIASGTATLRIEGYMTKANAYASEAVGLVVILDPDASKHEARVLVEDEVAVELQFDLLVSQEYQSIESGPDLT